MAASKSIIGYITKATKSRNAELIFVTYKQSGCVILSSTTLPYSEHHEYDGIDLKTGKILNKPTISGLHKYMLLYPDPLNSAEHFLFGVTHLLNHPHILETLSKTAILIPGLSGRIHDKVLATRVKDEEYNIFYAKESPETQKISEIHGFEIVFEKDKTEELGTFKMPLMIVGIGVALVYQVLCKGGEKKRPNRYGKGKHPMYNRSERMNNLTKRVNRLEKNFG
jgi:hypothetical protein